MERNLTTSPRDFDPNTYVGREYAVSPRIRDPKTPLDNPKGLDWSMPASVEEIDGGLYLRMPGARRTQYPLKPNHLITGVYNNLQLTLVPPRSSSLDKK